jgi:selenide,water dikinase
MGPGVLAQVLRPLGGMFPAEAYPDLLVGLEVSDDAAVYRASDGLAIILTVDFFAPVVDDPYDYGAIAAANAMSDVYAMGGEAVLALNICGFPIDLPSEMVSEILRGGAEKVAEAGAVLAGGHTVIDKEPKYGLAVMGFVHPDHIVTKARAKAGDVLVLTKPLGVGITAAALKGEIAKAEHVRAAAKVMKTLNRKAAQLMQRVGIDAVTDVTGFALLGHAQEMAEKSGVGIRLDLASLPFSEGAKEYAQEQIFPAGAHRNQECYDPHVRFAPSIPKWMQMLLYTPETSGGLLIAVPERKLGELAALFDRERQSYWVVGRVVDGRGVEVTEQG